MPDEGLWATWKQKIATVGFWLVLFLALYTIAVTILGFYFNGEISVETGFNFGNTPLVP